MSGGRSLLALLAAAMVLPATVPGQAAAPDTVSAGHRAVHWSGVLEGPAPAGCNGPNLGCDRHNFVVVAPRGAWITVSVAGDPNASVRVTTSDGELVGNGGQAEDLNPDDTVTPTTTFQQLRPGRVVYVAAVGDVTATPALPASYQATAQLAGKAFDRAGDCGVTSGLEHLQDTDDGRATPTLRVRLVA